MINKMVSLLVACSAIFFSSNTIDNTPIDRLGVKGPLEFNKTIFNLAWTDRPNDNYYIQEYLPIGEKTDHFNQMLTIHLFDTDLNVEQAVEQKVKELNTRKKTDAICNFQITESPDGKELIVDFLLGESKDDKMTIVEFNVYHYKQIEMAKNKKALVVYTYSKRSYGDNITNFLKTLKDDRTNHLNQMISIGIPDLSISR